MGVAIATGRKGYYKPGTRAWVSRISRKIRIPIAMYPCKVEERLTIELVEGREVEKIVTTMTKNGVVTRYPGKFHEYQLTDKEKEIERMMIYWEQVEYEVSDDDDSALKSTAGSVPKDYELGDTGPYQLVHVKFEISSWRGARVDVRTYRLGGVIDGSEANGIIRDPKLELESSCFTFDLVPLGYESVDVVIGYNWLLRHKAEMVCHEKVVKMPWSCKVRVGSNGNLLWETSVLLGRKKVRVAREDDHEVTEGREYVCKVFQQRGSRAKRKLSRCGRNQMGNELILALPEGADDFIVYYDARSKDLEACLEKDKVIARTSRQVKVLMKDCMTNVMLYHGVGRRSKAKNEFEIDVQRSDLDKDSIPILERIRWCGFRLSNRWLSMKKDVASCGSKYLAYSKVEIEYQGSSGLFLQPELPK
ncbi:putative reverse transcriptase domain-containing protein [Tanacetum coccineum]